MKLKLYTNDDILAGEIELPSGAMLLSNHNTVTKQLLIIQAAAKRHERGDPPKPGSNGGQTEPLSEWPGTRYHLIRQNIIEGINRYVLRHQPTGDFLMAVLTNNLKEAFGRADEDNRQVLHEIVGYVYNEIPGVCQGSAEKYKAWIQMDMAEWPNLAAPESTKERARQDAAGIWGASKFEEEG